MTLFNRDPDSTTEVLSQAFKRLISKNKNVFEISSLDPKLLCKLYFQGSSPRFIDDRECVITFLWETEAACPVKTTRDETQVRQEKGGICGLL